jgi:hypothetical protein
MGVTLELTMHQEWQNERSRSETKYWATARTECLGNGKPARMSFANESEPLPACLSHLRVFAI